MKMNERKFVMDWSIISKKFDACPISEFLYIWYEFDAEQSYNKLSNKTNSQRNKFKRIKSVISYLLTLVCDTESIDNLKERPDDLLEYKTWVISVRKMSYDLAERAFVHFQENNYLTKKVKTMNDLSVSNFIKILKQKTNTTGAFTEEKDESSTMNSSL